MSKQPGKNANPELAFHEKCGDLVGQDEFRIYPEHLKNLFFRNRLAEVFVGDSAFYVSESGKAVRTHILDNGADYFVEGLARTISDSKFGYIDEKLNVVIKPEYDFAFPFENGVTVVCTGCRLKKDGEHQVVVDGKWGMIDKSGEIVMPIKYSKEEFENNADYTRLKKEKTE